MCIRDSSSVMTFSLQRCRHVSELLVERAVTRGSGDGQVKTGQDQEHLQGDYQWRSPAAQKESTAHGAEKTQHDAGDSLRWADVDLPPRVHRSSFFGCISILHPPWCALCSSVGACEGACSGPSAGESLVMAGPMTNADRENMATRIASAI